LPEDKITAINDVEFLPGFKLFMKFSDQFYPDVITYETSSGEKTYYDVAYGKESEDNVFGLLSTGTSAEEYYALGSSDAIVASVLEELDTYYNGLASQNYLNSYVFKDWSQQEYAQGTWTSDTEVSSNSLNTSLNDKVYFAGETYNKHGETPTDDFYIIRGSVQSAILSGYEVVENIME
jgi:monoamine oxidase